MADSQAKELSNFRDGPFGFIDPMVAKQAKERSFYRNHVRKLRDPMADSQAKELSFYHNGVCKVRVGDSVIATYGAEGVEADVFARILSITSNTLGVNFRIQRYYSPEETAGGKQPFYGNKELLLTNHLDNLDPIQIVKKIYVHCFVGYIKLETVGPDDYFFRFEYEIGSGWLSPPIIKVFCKCQMPFNPDLFTLKCESCKERYHPDCINMTLDEAKQLANNFTCLDCLIPDNQGSASASSATVDLSDGGTQACKEMISTLVLK